MNKIETFGSGVRRTKSYILSFLNGFNNKKIQRFLFQTNEWSS